MRTNTYIKLAALFSASVGLVAVPQYAGAIPIHSETEAIDSARRFCQQIGTPITAPAGAELSPHARLPYVYWQPCWRVDFGGKVELNITQDSGSICAYSNEALWQTLAGIHTPATAEISPSEAVGRALAALQTAGAPLTELAFSTVTREGPQHVENASDRMYQVRWVRTYAGVPYRNQGATVIVFADTGAIMILTIHFNSPRPTRGPSVVDLNDAATRALAHLDRAGITDELLDSVELKVVEPDSCHGSAINVSDDPARLAWECRFHGYGHSADVLVDAVDGKVHWWEDSMPGGGPGPSPPAASTVGNILGSASEIQLFTRDSKWRWAVKPAAISRDRRLLKDPGAASRLSSPGPVATARYKLVVHGGARAEDLYYLPDHNLIGRPADWYHPGPELRAWLDRQVSKTHR